MHLSMKILILMLGATSAAKLAHHHNGTHLGRERISSRAFLSYKGDCGKKSGLRIMPQAKALLQEHNVPGAGIKGMKDFEPFGTVLKDGFMGIDCVKDYMYYRGDKFGDNKHDYKLDDTSKVSIVHYEAFVAKEDRKPMTQKVCFEFCRTVPNMGFFGIVNGRGCYCTPYFKAMESDSTQCDAVCEGETTLLCGGKSKSSIFSMHMCASTLDDLEATWENAGEHYILSDYGHNLLTLKEEMQHIGEEGQKMFGAVGDSAATGHFQAAKVFAGKIEAEMKKGDALMTAYEELDTRKSNFGDEANTDAKAMKEAETLMDDIDEWADKAELQIKTSSKILDQSSYDELKDVHSSSSHDQHAEDLNSGRDLQYYNVMYFVDKKYEKKPTVCGGVMLGEPIFSPDRYVSGHRGTGDCAKKCDDTVGCVAYQWISTMCIKFSKLDTVTYYSGCYDVDEYGSDCRGGECHRNYGKFLQKNSSSLQKKASFLQKKASKDSRDPEEEEEADASGIAVCLAKLSKFEGTTLKVDKSGKTDFGLKKLTKADRCF